MLDLFIDLLNGDLEPRGKTLFTHTLRIGCAAVDKALVYSPLVASDRLAAVTALHT